MQKGGQDLSQGMDDVMGHVLCSGTELKHRKNLREGINGQPEPEHLCGAAQPGAQFIQLQVREVQMAEEALMQDLRVLTSTRQPGGNGGLSKAEDPLGSRKIQPLGQRRQNHGDLLGESFQLVQRRVAPRTERRTTSLTAKGLDPLDMAMLAISDQRVNLSISDAKVEARSVGTGEAFGVYPLGCSAAAFHLTPGADKRRRRSHTGPSSGGETTGGAIERAARVEQTVEPGALDPSW